MAPRVIADAAEASRKAGRAGPGAVVVGVTGPVGAGKSTLARRLSACVVSTDNYLPDHETIEYLERDHPRHADFARLATDLAALRRGSGIRVPVWSFQSHRREGTRELAPSEIVVCEGIHALADGVREHVDIGVCVEASGATRWERWADLEWRGARGWGVERARAYFEQVAEPTFAAFEAEYRAAAQFVVVNDG